MRNLMTPPRQPELNLIKTKINKAQADTKFKNFVSKNSNKISSIGNAVASVTGSMSNMNGSISAEAGAAREGMRSAIGQFGP